MTRWGAILFQIRSVLRLTHDDLKSVRNQMPDKNEKQRAARRKFHLSAESREKLTELVKVLEEFEWATDELQGDGITISK